MAPNAQRRPAVRWEGVNFFGGNMLHYVLALKESMMNDRFKPPNSKMYYKCTSMDKKTHFQS